MNPKEFNDSVRDYTLDDVKTLHDQFTVGRMPLERTWKVLDAYDSGKFWDVMKTKLPKHQIIPDTNEIFYVKNNQLNSVYSAPYLADVMAVDPGDTDESRQINKLLEFTYNRLNIGEKQLEAGERTALLNVGFLQLAWNKNARYHVEEKEHKGIDTEGDIEVIVRDPLAVKLDPNFKDFQRGRALFITTQESYTNLVAEYPERKEELDNYVRIQKEDKKKTNPTTSVISTGGIGLDAGNDYLAKDVRPIEVGMFNVVIAYYKWAQNDGGFRIDQIVYTNGDIVLEYVKGIEPNYFPVVALYNLPPERDGYGVGVCARVLRNALALNVLDSIAVTHTYAAQRTPLILDLRSGLNPERVTQDMNNPDKLFLVSGGVARDALLRLEYPALPPNLQQIRQGLEESIDRISGIDARYTGRETGSVQTTGGMERMQQRVSMSDNTRIAMIEKYAKELTRMILDFYVQYGGKRACIAVNNYEEKVKEIMVVDFNKYRDNKKTFLYSIEASPLLPKNRARLAEAANIIMQVQMQYGGQIQLLTPEEWMFFQDFPQKNMILDRMAIDRLRNDEQEIASELTSFSSMTEQGARPEAAVQQLAQERAMRREPAVMNKILQGQVK